MSEEQGGQSEGGGQQETTWTTGLSEEDVGFLSNKGFAAPADLLKGYRNLESLRGVPADRLLKLPMDDADPSEWDPIYTRLGRPASAEEYGFKPENLQEGQVDLGSWFQEQAFNAGLSKEKAQAMLGSFAELQEKTRTAREQQLNQRDTAQMQDLQREWGQTFEERKAIAERYFMAAGWYGEDGKFLDALQDVKGEGELYRLGYKLGQSMSEPSFVGSDSKPGGAGMRMSPGEAKARLRELKSDREYMEKWNKGDVAKVSEMRRLEEIANPQQGEFYDPVLDTRGGPPQR